MFALIALIAKFLAGSIDLAKSLVSEHDKEQERESGRLEEQARQQLQKEKDEQIANRIDASPAPDKHHILDGLRPPP